MRKAFIATAGALLATGCLIAAPVVASAHAVLNAGAYRVAIGWAYEPSSGSDTYVGQINAIQVFVDKPQPGNEVGTPVGDLNGDCTKPDFQVTVKVGNITSSPFCPAPTYDPDTRSGRMDEYDYPMTPTVVGTYTFHIYGTIHGAPIDQTIASGPSTFDSLANPSTIDFPTTVPPTSAIVTKLDQVSQRMSSAQSAAQSASSSASTATILAIIGIVLAVVLGGASLALGLRRRMP